VGGRVPNSFDRGFINRKPSGENAACHQAFVVNRVGDFAFLLAIFGESI